MTDELELTSSEITEVLKRLDEEDKKLDLEWKYHHRSLDEISDEALSVLPEPEVSGEEDTTKPPPESHGPSSAHNDQLRAAQPRKRLLRRKRKEIGFSHARPGTRAVRFFSESSGGKATWTFHFTPEKAARFSLFRQVLESDLIDCSEKERIAIMVFTFGSLCETGQLTRKELARRFKIKYQRVCHLIAQYHGACVAKFTWLNSMDFLNQNRAIGIYEKKGIAGIELYYLQTTDDLAFYVYATEKVHTLPQWKGRFSLIHWQLGAIPR